MLALKKPFLIFLWLVSIACTQAYQFNKVIIWGHKLHSHTHSYIHEAFYKAFEAMGYDTYWLDNHDDVSKFDFKNCLFLTEGQVCQKMPVVDSSYYLLHNVEASKFKKVYDSGRALAFQVYTHRCVGQHADIEMLAPCMYASKSGKIVYMPWATDLLPEEIDDIKERVKKGWGTKKERVVYWIGTIGGGMHGNNDPITPFKQACSKNGIQFKQLTRVSADENRRLTFNSYMAPTLVGKWQCDEGYIPCRIFKTVSYGQAGVTNSKAVYDLFEHKIVYNADTEKLFHDARAQVKKSSLQDRLDLMEFVKTKHTYVNRIETLLNFLEECSREN